MGRDLVPKRKNDTYKVIYFMQLSDVPTYTILSCRIPILTDPWTGVG